MAQFSRAFPLGAESGRGTQLDARARIELDMLLVTVWRVLDNAVNEPVTTRLGYPASILDLK